MRDLLNLYKYDGDNITIIRGSALAAATGGDPVIGRDAIYALMDAVSGKVDVLCIVRICYLARNLRSVCPNT